MSVEQQTHSPVDDFAKAAAGLFEITGRYIEYLEQGVHGCAIAKPRAFRVTLQSRHGIQMPCSHDSPAVAASSLLLLFGVWLRADRAAAPMRRRSGWPAKLRPPHRTTSVLRAGGTWPVSATACGWRLRSRARRRSASSYSKPSKKITQDRNQGLLAVATSQAGCETKVVDGNALGHRLDPPGASALGDGGSGSGPLN